MTDLPVGARKAPNPALMLLIRLQPDRRQVGTLSVVEDDQGVRKIALVIDARGKADSASADRAGNQRRNPRQPFGDTPCGRWFGCTIVRRPQWTAGRVDGIGEFWIPLPYERAGDQATRDLLNPAIKGHRDALGIHGGRGDGDLVATQGCVRVRDRDFARLHEVIGGEQFDVVITDEPA